MNPPQTVSVLICTYNRPELLSNALDALLACQPPPDEIVVVNGGGAASSAIVAARQPAFPALKLLHTANINLATSRNIGFTACTGEIIALTDDDARVCPDWVAAIRAAFATYPEAGAVGGPVFALPGSRLLNLAADRVTFPAWRTPRSVRTLPGVNIAYRQSAWLTLGSQDETLARGEDVDFNWRLYQAGHAIWYTPAICVYHRHRPTFGALLEQQYQYGRWYVRVRAKWPQMYCVYPHRLRNLKDILKALHFLAALLYQPLWLAINGPGRLWEKLAIWPLVLGLNLAWKTGMLAQLLNRPPQQPPA